MYLTRICAFVFLVTASCAPDDRSFTIDASFTGPQKSAITSAADKWSEVLAEPIDVHGGTWTMKHGPVPQGLVAYTDNDARTITIGPDVRDEELYAVVLHELGHSVGFVHHDEVGVMNHVYGATEFSVADVAECKALHRCRDKLQAHVDVHAAP